MSRSPAEAFEKVPTVIFPDSAAAAKALAQEVKDIITAKNKAGQPAVLGMATGSTPVPFYRELIRLHKEEGLSFKNVITFNLDEYFGLSADHPESYARFMAEQIFDHIDIPKANINIPSGTLRSDQVFSHCRDYEQKIDSLGGIDLQILGIGRTGHIGFNEPGSSRDSLTRRITLDRVTRQDAASDFRGEQNVPHFAITMGVGTILRAKKLVLMAWGENKAGVVAKAVEGPMTEAVSASFLQDHADARFFIDNGASRELTRVKLPWLTGTPVSWTPRETRRAMVWQAFQTKRPILKLIDEHYNEHGLSDLLSEQGPSYQLNIRIFNQLQHTITGWPGGKPDEDDTIAPSARGLIQSAASFCRRSRRTRSSAWAARSTVSSSKVTKCASSRSPAAICACRTARRTSSPKRCTNWHQTPPSPAIGKRRRPMPKTRSPSSRPKASSVRTRCCCEI
jgi:glucosamine-6-phosphate deaminase